MKNIARYYEDLLQYNFLPYWSKYVDETIKLKLEQKRGE